MKCDTYQQIEGCVTNSNIEKHSGKTLAECKEICDKATDCKGFDFFTASGEDNTNPDNKEGDCSIKSDDTIEDCDYKFE